MARRGRPERNRAARSFRQLRRFHHVSNSDEVFGTHRPFMRKQDYRAASSQMISYGSNSRPTRQRGGWVAPVHHRHAAERQPGHLPQHEAFPWDGAYMIRDRDNRCGEWHRPCHPPQPCSVKACEAVKLQRAKRSRGIVGSPDFAPLRPVANWLATACSLV